MIRAADSYRQRDPDFSVPLFSVSHFSAVITTFGEMTKQDRQCQIDVVELSDSEESGQDERSDGDSERSQLNPQTVFKKMMHVATRMDQKVRQQQKFVLSMAMRAIDKVNADSQSDAARKKRKQKTTQGKGTAKRETQRKPLCPISPASSRVEQYWSPGDFALVKKLRAKNVRWVDISKHHLPGRTREAIRARYIWWLENSKNLEDEEMVDKPEADRIEELESEISWSDQKNLKTEADLPF